MFMVSWWCFAVLSLWCRCLVHYFFSSSFFPKSNHSFYTIARVRIYYYYFFFLTAISQRFLLVFYRMSSLLIDVNLSFSYIFLTFILYIRFPYQEWNIDELRGSLRIFNLEMNDKNKSDDRPRMSSLSVFWSLTTNANKRDKLDGTQTRTHHGRGKVFNALIKPHTNTTPTPPTLQHRQPKQLLPRPKFPVGRKENGKRRRRRWRRRRGRRLRGTMRYIRSQEVGFQEVKIGEEGNRTESETKLT